MSRFAVGTAPKRERRVTAIRVVAPSAQPDHARWSFEIDDEAEMHRRLPKLAAEFLLSVRNGSPPGWLKVAFVEACWRRLVAFPRSIRSVESP